jgi:DtxR family Mn-dependent transcriptional regulator
VSPRSSVERADDAVSSTVGRYLEAIFYIQGEREVARASRIAEWVGVSQPTVAAAIGRMVRDGMIKVGSERELEFTKKGRDLASSIVRRHRIAERWLVDVLKFDWLQADLEAGQLEHGMSMAVADKLHELMGKPTTCPHGNPIPGVAAPRRAERPLATMQPGQSAPLRRVSEVAEHDAPDLLSFLAENHFTLGGRIEMLEASRGAGTVTIHVNGHRVSMSREVAGKIWVDE